jgi:hypothetical protein
MNRSSEPPDATLDRRARLWATFGLGALMALLAWSLLGVPWLPTNDGLNHVYMAWVMNHRTDPGSALTDIIVPIRQFSNLGFITLYRPLELVLPWRTALQVALVLIVSLWAGGAMALVRAVADQRPSSTSADTTDSSSRPSVPGSWLLMAPLAAPLALQWSIYMGFFSFSLTTGLTFWLLAWAIRAAVWRWWHFAGMGLGLVICAASHIFPALLAGLALGLVLVSRHWKAPRTLFVQLTALFIASVPTLLLVAASTATAEADSDGSVQAAWHSVSGRLPVLARLLVAGEAWRTWPLLAVVALGLLCAWFRPGRLRADQRAILWLGTLCLALFVLAPMNLPGWQFFATRFAPMAAVCGLALTAVCMNRLKGPARPLVGACVFVYAGACLWGALQLHEQIHERCGTAFDAAAQPVERDRMRLFVPLEYCMPDEGTPLATVPRAVHQNQGATVYAMQQSGVAVVFHGFPAYHPYDMRPPDASWIVEFVSEHQGYVLGELMAEINAGQATPENLEFAHQLASRFARAAATYGDLILHGETSLRSLILARGFQTDVETARAWVGRFTGCPLTITFADGAPTGGAVLLEHAWFPLDEPRTRLALNPAELAPTGLPVPLHPCGRSWLQLVHDRDSSAGLSPGDRVCEGTDARGMLFYEMANPQPQTFVCRWVDVSAPPQPTGQ